MKYEWPLREAIPHKCVFLTLLASQDALEVMLVTDLTHDCEPKEDFTDVTLVIDYAY